AGCTTCRQQKMSGLGILRIGEAGRLGKHEDGYAAALQLEHPRQPAILRIRHVAHKRCRDAAQRSLAGAREKCRHLGLRELVGVLPLKLSESLRVEAPDMQRTRRIETVRLQIEADLCLLGVIAPVVSREKTGVAQPQ